MINVPLVQFLIENSLELLRTPLSGHLNDIYTIFSDDYCGATTEEDKDDDYTFTRFVRDLGDINAVAVDSIQLRDSRRFMLVDTVDHLHDGTISFIDTFALKTLEKKLLLHGGNYNKSNDIITTTDNDSNKNNLTKKGPLDRLLTVLDFESDYSPGNNDYYNNRQCKVLYGRLDSLLHTKPVSFELARERAQVITTRDQCIPICSDKHHSLQLTNLVYIVNNKIVSMQWNKINKMDTDNNNNRDSKDPEFIDCIQTHIHFVPNLKPQTDLSLGDCSYLDTCHKLNSCRYLHYLQYIPEVLMQKTMDEAQQYDAQVQLYHPLYTFGFCCSFINKDLLPPQWIKCDVRKFDFKILGKFSVVVADPAWNIHMNLPYGTCNDIELLELPLDDLQDEGILFLWVTGRAIELGKESLMNWGYEVINEMSWIKTNQLGRTIVTGRTGHWLNHSKEHLLVGMKGNPQWISKHIDIDLIVSTTRETSRKPDELYGIIERLVGPHARKLEIFGRDHNIRPGWFTIGNQLSGNCIHEMDVKQKYDAFVGGNQPNDNKYRENRKGNDNTTTSGNNNNNNNNSNNNLSSGRSSNKPYRQTTTPSQGQKYNNGKYSRRQFSSKRVANNNNGINNTLDGMANNYTNGMVSNYTNSMNNNNNVQYLPYTTENNSEYYYT